MTKGSDRLWKVSDETRLGCLGVITGRAPRHFFITLPSDIELWDILKFLEGSLKFESGLKPERLVDP